MKRVLSIALAGILTMSVLAGCGDSADSADAKNLSKIDLEKYVTGVSDYKGMELTGELEGISDEDVEYYVDFMLEQSKEQSPVTDRAVQDGDVVNIDFEGKKDGVAFDGGTAEGYDLEIGSGSFIEGFEEGLIGCNIGDTVDLDLTFPEDYHSEELAGQPVVFTVTVNSISELVRPELNDEYVQSLGMDYCQNVDEFYDAVRISLEDSAEASYKNELQTQISQKLMEICQFSDDVPEGLFDYYKEQIRSNFENQATSQGMELMDFVTQYYGMTEEQFNTEVDNGAANSARQAMACAFIAQKEGIEVTDEELNEKVEENYANFGYESVEAYMKDGNPEDYRDYLLTTKVLDFLMENAVVTADATDATAEETVAAETEAETAEE